jgi:hypothetical protein
LFFFNDLDLKREYVIGHTGIPLHTYEVAAEIIDVVLNGPFGKSPD